MSNSRDGAVTNVVVVRHGETDWNVIHRLQGITDTKLTETGMLQAARVAHRLSKSGAFSKVISSDLSRAHDTAKEIIKVCEVSHTSVVLDERLREFHLGIFSGHTHAEARSKFPHEWNEYLSNDAFTIPEGESYSDFIIRTTRALREYVDSHRGHRICIVTHGGVIDAIKTALIPETESFACEGRCGNACICEFRVGSDGKWSVIRWNDVSHLAALRRKVLEADDVVEHDHHTHPH